MTNKEKFMQYVEWRRKQKEYEKRALDCDIRYISIRGYERTSRRKIGQFTRRR